MLYSESSKKTDKNAPTLTQVFKRPHGVAVQNLGDMLNHKEGESEEKEFTLKVRFFYLLIFYLFNFIFPFWGTIQVYQGEEKDFHQLHELIIRQTGKYSALSCQPNYGE